MNRLIIALAVLLSATAALQAQVKVPVFGKISYLKGYIKEISGENIGYFSALPDFANTALLTRCTDGKNAIEWETEAVPRDAGGKFVYFAWVAAHSKATSSGDRHFDLYINNKKALSFTTLDKKQLPFWSFSSPEGETLLFDWKTDDGAGDAHGYMYLKIPLSRVEKGKPLRLKIVGANENSRDWFMTFKYEFAESIQLSPVSLLTRDNKQPIQVLATHFGAEVPLRLLLEQGKEFRFMLQPGMNTFEITHEAVTTVTPVKVTARIPGRPDQEFMLNLKPVTYREIHLIHHAHYDVGYSAMQEEVVKIHNRNIANALRYIEQTRNLPWEAQFKWNIETTLAIENFLKIASPDQKQTLIRDIRDGHIGIGGLYANIMTGICQPEELFNLNRYSRQLEKDWNIQIPAAMIGDVPGLSWGTIPALARSGIKYFSDGPNYTGSVPYSGDRVGNSNNNWADKPFWWVSPSGNEKILFWMAGKGYSSWHGFKAGDIGIRGKKKISAYMDELYAEGYPYEMVQWRYNIVSDNGPTDSLISQFVLEWNRTYSSPKIVLNTVDALFREFEKRYGDKIPSFRGDLTPYWEDGAYSSTAEMALNRHSSEKLTSLETLYSIAAPDRYDAQQFDAAWRNVLLWDEHTWGAYNSISDPDVPFVTGQWKYKRHYAMAADSLLTVLENKLILPESKSRLPEKLDVFNTSSWERSDVVYMDAANASLLSNILDDKGLPVPMQKLSDGRAAFLAEAVPALGSKRYSLQRKEGEVQLSWQNPEVSSLESASVKLLIDEQSGSIRSLVYKPLNRELVETSKHSGLDEYLYVPGRDPKQAVSNGKVSIRLKEEGPLLGTLRIESDAPGCRHLIREITLLKSLNRLEITNTLDKKAVREKEAVHFAFPFAVPEARERFNTGWGGIFSPGENQLAGANQDYYSVQHWCDVSGQQAGISLLLNDACLVEPGAMIDEQTGKYGVKTWKTEPDKTPILYSYAMNNYWHTNYKADQEGFVSLHYALIPHGMFNLAEVERQGMEFNQPLILVPVNNTATVPSLFTLSDPNILLTSMVPEGKGFRIRLFNAGGSPVDFRIRWGSLQPLKLSLLNGNENLNTLQPDTLLHLPASGIMEMEINK